MSGFDDITSSSEELTDAEDVVDDFESVPALQRQIQQAKPDVTSYGLEASTQNLYRERHGEPWVTEMPDSLRQLKSDRSDKRFALIVRRQLQGLDDPRLALHSIVVQSPFLKSVLQDTFRDYRGIAAQLSQAVFKRPFHEFVYRWKDYLVRTESETDETAKEHIGLFDAVIKPEITPLLEQRKDFIENQVISYPHLWMLFEPDIAVHTTTHGCDRVYQIMSAEYKANEFAIHCRFVSHDGRRFGYEMSTLTISEFDGHMSIEDLSVKPLEYHPRKKDLESRLLARGRRFEQLKGLHYMTYAGMVHYSAQFGWEPENLESGRIVIDRGLFLNQNPHLATVLSPLDKADTAVDSEEDTEEPQGPVNPFGPAFPGLQMPYSTPPPMPAPHRKRRSTRSQHNHPHAEGSRTRTRLSKTLDAHHYILCTPVLNGYCLATKRWARFFIDQVTPIKWSDSAFKRLILPHDYKELILAVVNSHTTRGMDFDDIIEGKGRGIIILLQGEPGVGKTLTAEAVAEELRQPLYSMSAGELGWDAGSVEQTLRNVLEICAKWKAVLLLDECDVFLEQRTVADLQRNKLVSIFLRTLEYYRGVLFLTTNRVSAFDKAFKSRIDLNITYPALDSDSRKQIWSTFATPSPEFPNNLSELKEEDLETFASLTLNGREIKNVVKTGRLFARWRGETLNAGHLRTALRVHNGEPELGLKGDGEW